MGRAGPKPIRVDKTQPALTDVQHRLLFAQVLEAVRALEEGVLTDIREGDVGAILGWGFAPWSGGPFSLARHDRRGPRGGDLPTPDRPVRPALPRARRCCARWRRRARRFYGRFAGGKAA